MNKPKQRSKKSEKEKKIKEIHDVFKNGESFNEIKDSSGDLDN